MVVHYPTRFYFPICSSSQRLHFVDLSSQSTWILWHVDPNARTPSMYTIDVLSPNLVHAHLTPSGTRATSLHAGLLRAMPAKTPAILCEWSRAIAALTGCPAVLWHRAGLMIASWDAETGFEPLMRVARDPRAKLARLQEDEARAERERQEDLAHRDALRRLRFTLDTEDLAALRAHRRGIALLREQAAKERAKERYQARKAARQLARDEGHPPESARPPAPALAPRDLDPFFDPDDTPPPGTALMSPEQWVSMSLAEREAYEAKAHPPLDALEAERTRERRRYDAERKAASARLHEVAIDPKRAAPFAEWRKAQVEAGALPTEPPPIPPLRIPAPLDPRKG